MAPVSACSVSSQPDSPASPNVTATSTTTKAEAACTGDAIGAALAAEVRTTVNVKSYQCKNGWAAGSDLLVDRNVEAAFLLQDVNGQWIVPEPMPCSDPSIPRIILNSSPCGVS
jgi:hypothetical protein